MRKADRVLAEMLRQEGYATDPAHDIGAARPLLGKLVEQALAKESPAVARQLRHFAGTIPEARVPRAPPLIREWMEQAILRPALFPWAHSVLSPAAREPEDDAFHQRLTDWFDGLPDEDQAKVLGAAIRHQIGLKIDSDEEPRRKLTEALAPSKENSMATITFVFDTRGLPASLRNPTAQADWEAAVEDEILNLGLARGSDEKSKAAYAAMKGMLLLDQQFDFSTSEFPQAVRGVWLETLGTTIDNYGAPVANRDVYPKIATAMAAILAPGAAAASLLLQQFASVGRYFVENAQDVPDKSPLFDSQVRLGMDRYVAGPPAAETLDLPELTGPAVQDAELDGQNMFAFSTVYAIAQLDEMKVFYTVDRLTEDFLNGVLATQHDAGGKLLDEWFWARRDRMTEADRRSVFSRMLGMPGGDVPKDVQPNIPFNDRFLGFLSSVAEFDRQQRISDLFTSTLAGNRGGSLAMTMENVRQKGHDLGANMSLYAYGYAHFAARRLNADFSNALNILKHPVITKLLGVTTPYQVIERKCIADFGKAPDIVRLRTMADAGKRIIDIVAKNSAAWSSASGLPLFPDLAAVAVGRQAAAASGKAPILSQIKAAGGPSAISVEDTEELIRQTQFWLAVNGLQYEDVDRRAQPKLNPYEPSIPAFSGLTSSTMPVNGAGAGSAMDKIKQMVSSGQAPTLDQLKSMLPGGFTN